jgi:hypothetical protein
MGQRLFSVVYGVVWCGVVWCGAMAERKRGKVGG